MLENTEKFLIAEIVFVALVFLALYLMGRNVEKNRRIGIATESVEFEKISIEITGKKGDTNKTEIVEFTVSVPVVFKSKYEVTACDNVNDSSYAVEELDGIEKGGMIITPYKVRIYKASEVVITVSVTTQNLYKKEKDELIDI